jgi:hypothetical protein
MADVGSMCVNIQGEKDGVVEWIEKVRAKKREFEKRVTKNLRVEAVFSRKRHSTGEAARTPKKATVAPPATTSPHSG